MNVAGGELELQRARQISELNPAAEARVSFFFS